MMTDGINISELEREMMELFDDYGYNKEEKARLAQINNNINKLDDIGDEQYIDMNYIETSNPVSQQDYTSIDMNKKEEPESVGKDFINNILNDKSAHGSPSKKILGKQCDNFLLDELDEESREKIKNELANEESDLYNTMEEHDESIFHLNKLQLLKSKVYKAYLKKRRKSSTTSVVSDTEIELNADDIQYAIEKEDELIKILLNNIRRYLSDNNIKYDDRIFDLNSYDNYKIVDDPKEEINGSCGIIYINIVPNNQNTCETCVCANNKCITVGIKKNMIVTTKNFHRYRYVNTNKILFKKIKINDICYLIEKHKQ